MGSLCSPAATSDPNQSPGKRTFLIIRDISWGRKDRLIYPFLLLDKPRSLTAIASRICGITRVTGRHSYNSFGPIHIPSPRLPTSGECPKNASLGAVSGEPYGQWHPRRHRRRAQSRAGHARPPSIQNSISSEMQPSENSLSASKTSFVCSD